MKSFYVIIALSLSLVFLSFVTIAQTSVYQESYDLYTQGRYDAALEQLEKVYTESKNVHVLLLAGDIHFALAKEKYFQSRDALLAAKFFNQVKSISQENSAYAIEADLTMVKLWQEIVKAAAQLEGEQKYKESLQLLEQAIQVRPDDTQTYMTAAKLAFGIKDYKTAEKNFSYLIDSLNYDGAKIQEVLNGLLAISLIEKNQNDYTTSLERTFEAKSDSTGNYQLEIENMLNNNSLEDVNLWIGELQADSTILAKLYFEVAQKLSLDNKTEESIDYLVKTLKADSLLTDARYMLALNYQKLAQIKLTKVTGNNTNAEQLKSEARNYLDRSKNELNKLMEYQPDYPLLNYTLNSIEESIERLS